MSAQNETIITIEPDGSPPRVEHTVDSILKMLSEGASIQIVAARLNLDPAKVLAVSQQTKQQVTDGSQKLSTYLDQVDELADIAHWQAKAEPSPNNIYAYTALVETARGILQDQEARRDPAKLREALLSELLQPFCEALVGQMTDKLRDSKNYMLAITAPERHSEVVFQIDGILRALGASIKDQLDAAHLVIDKLLIDKPTKPQTAMTRAGGLKRRG